MDEGYIPFPQEDNHALVEEIQVLHARQDYLLQLVEGWYDSLIKIPKFELAHLIEDPTVELLNGIHRLKQHLIKEGKHLKSLLLDESLIQPHHLNCSNLPYLEAVYFSARKQKGLASLFKTFNYKIINENNEIFYDKLVVDIVCNNGKDWIKVSARNNKYLKEQSKIMRAEMDDFDYSEIEGKAFQFYHASINNQIHFIIPNIRFQFISINFNSVEFQPLIHKLYKMNITVEKLELCHDINIKHDLGDVRKLSTNILNLDCTTLIALASELTNNYNDTFYLDPIKYKHTHALSIQVEQEKNKPLLPILIHLFKNHQLVTTQSCYQKFFEITNTLAGEKEKQRAYIMFRHHHNDQALINNDNLILPQDPFLNYKKYTNQPHSPIINVIPDIFNIEFKNLLNNKFHKLYKELHMVIFGTGYQNKITTVTANNWITNAIVDKSYLPDANFILLHEPRSFVENKL